MLYSKHTSLVPSHHPDLGPGPGPVPNRGTFSGSDTHGTAPLNPRNVVYDVSQLSKSFNNTSSHSTKQIDTAKDESTPHFIKGSKPLKSTVSSDNKNAPKSFDLPVQ